MMTTWIGDAQVTYLALRGGHGWTLTRSVAGAGAIALGERHEDTARREAGRARRRRLQGFFENGLALDRNATTQ